MKGGPQEPNCISEIGLINSCTKTRSMNYRSMKSDLLFGRIGRDQIDLNSVLDFIFDKKLDYLTQTNSRQVGF